MLPPGLRTPREVVLYYDQVYFDLVDSGRAHQFLYPWGAAGAVLILAYLLLDHRNSRLLQWCRFPVFGAFSAFQSWCIFTNRARSPASAFGVGLISSWGWLWVSAIMVVNDCQVDFKRIERAIIGPGSKNEREHPHRHGANGSVESAPEDDTLRQRKAVERPDDPSRAEPHSVQYFWQAYPSAPFLVRLDWVADVFCSFRGVGWDWQTAGVPPPPKSVEVGLRGEVPDPSKDEEFTTSRTGIRRYAHRGALLRHSFTSLAIGYLALDALKTFMHQDPYFWGYTDSPAPVFMPTVVRDSYFLTKTYRLLLSLAAIYFALWTIFKLGPAFFCGILGPKWIGVRGEPWMNPADSFGSFMPVLDKGLAGWWGGWWHQTFRFAFESPAARLTEALGISKRSTIGRLLSLFIAFFLSGCLHACGSYTQLGETRPVLGPMRFFILQAVGISMQTLGVQQLKRAGIIERCPKALCQLTNLVVVHVWLYYTAPLLVDDFAKGGVWLFEPVPFSLFRGLGLGAPDDGWFCLSHGVAWWHSGKAIFDTGIAL
ncbi:hypothetical protein BAUCODRAFT_441546 [Baudoinia panamericana UAMH 10762]|uniref:Wax synthase domain-containing protein n=1 Tax=Baudoinia panamericana (strain UAMH 10762) TaxID=717646 RepID=M2NE15_BAUPA|nr:uncharacterized protein BAUCODRAFT_441546 [Baudoinia panamericana UAMH 10762]EMC97175.1 hypothetical protein BAUCODRAFT_441546 [Baudoinia panamericana UAMH 10762]